MTGGSATVLSSSAGETPWPGHTIYNTAMASLNMMVRCAALENAHHQVRVNAVAPGYVRSEDGGRQNREFHNALTPEQNQLILGDAAAHTPLLGYTGKLPDGSDGQYVYQIQEPLDVASQMLWLGSQNASFMNGEVLVIDGGLTTTTADYG